MDFQELIIKKRDGHQHSKDEIEFLVKNISDGSMPDYQVAAWAMAVFFQGMSDEETRDLTLAMAYSGDVVDLSGIAGIKVDKHSTGGVGDKTTLVVTPIVAAAGIPVAKMSGRGLGHTGGTIDKFESIPGFQVHLSHQAFLDQVNQVGAAVIAQSGNLVPADKRLYSLRDLTGTVDSIPLIASSVMSKKLAAGADAILLDVKVGRGAFMKTAAQAQILADTMVEIGRGVGRKVIALLSDMDQPLGRMVGNALEVREAIDTLQGKGPEDLSELCQTLAAHMIMLGGKAATLDEALEITRQLIVSGQALARFKKMITVQGGTLDYQADNYGMEIARIRYLLRSERSGQIIDLDALEIGRSAMLLGAGREKIGDVIDHAVGIELCRKRGDVVEKDDILAIIHGNDHERVQSILPQLLQAYKIQ
ncbi:MAG: thymidine phosphorylase [Syntrophomonadaceae bacterium]|nr:thymidine phosphorylase [Syntrophomonadaceae bacterium]